MEIEVKGHSGCPIDIVREGNDLFIYKSSYDKNYLERLEKQALKQQKASEQEYQHIRIPEIFDVVHDDNHVTIKMEYVYSRNFIEYFESAGFEQINYFIKALVLFIERELQYSPIQVVKTGKTLAKFYDVKSKIFRNQLLLGDQEIKGIVELSETKFVEFAKLDTIQIPVGICHGDLTFSNILFNGNNYYLIDFLDSFIESPLLDIVKIRQDSAFLWSQLMYVKSYDKLRLKMICDKIDNEINGYFQKYNWYRDFYEIYQLMNLLRILQYAKEERVVKYLKKSIYMLLYPQIPSDKDKRIESKQGDSFNLIIPAAADNVTCQGHLPYVFGLDSSGVMLCIKAIQGLNLTTFDNIYFTVLKKHIEAFYIDEMMRLQFKRFGIFNAKIVVLDEPTSSQSETIYKTIRQEKIQGGIFIKDADGFFEAEVIRGNSICVYPLEKMHMVDPRNKSYVSIDDLYCITNIIEKKIISHTFNTGGICLMDSSDFCFYYNSLLRYNERILLSHIIYAMLLDKYKFRPIDVDKYIDWGNEMLVTHYFSGLTLNE